MRVASSIVAVIVFASLCLALLLWQKFDSRFDGRDHIVRPLLLVFVLTGPIAALVAIALATTRRPVAVGFGVYSILHGSIFIYFQWRGGFTPGLLDVVAALSICIGLRAVMMLTKKA
jgi:hypothetical protein